MSPQPISEPTQKGCSRIALSLFGFIFAAVGGVLFWFLFISPVWSYFQAQTWAESQCRVTASRVEVHEDSEGDSYEPIVEYEYRVDNQQFTGDTVNFLAFNSSSRRRWANGVVKKYKIGSMHTVYYNPADPSESVLDRSWDHSNWFGLFPLIFFLVGFGLLAGSIFAGFKATSANQSPQYKTQLATKLKQGNFTPSEADELDREMDVPQKLKPTQSRLGIVAVLLGISLFWNGIVSVFVVSSISDGFQWFDIFLGLFLTPFVLIGIVLIAVLVHQFLNLFNPKVEIGLSSGAVPIGGEVDIAWEINGGLRKFQQLAISIEGEESATYVQGTDTHTETQLFAQVDVVSTDRPSEIGFGSTTVKIPANTMHTFEGENNQVIWVVRVHGSIPWWPDVDETFSFRVKPA